MEELVERGRLDAQKSLCLGDEPPSAMSRAILRAAAPVRLPLLVWSMYSRSRSMVNSCPACPRTRAPAARCLSRNCR